MSRHSSTVIPRALRIGLALAVFGLVLAVVSRAAVSSPRGASLPGAPAFELRHSTEDEVSFIFRLGADPVIETVGPPGHRRARVRFAGGESPLTPGVPDIVEVSARIGVPAEGELIIDAVPVNETLVPLPAEMDAVPMSEHDAAGGLEAGDLRTPRPLAEIGGAPTFRGLRVAGLILRPVRYDAARGALSVAREIRVTVRCANPSRFERRSASSEHRPVRGGHDDALLRDFVLNWESARAWRRESPAPARFAPASRAPALDPPAPPVRAALGGSEYFDASRNWCRIEIATTGIYEITYNALEAAGVEPPELIDPASIRLFNGGGLALPESVDVARRDWMEEVAIEVDAPTGTFSPGSRVVFHALGSSGYLTEYDPTLPTNHVEHAFSTVNVYWLTWHEAGDPPSGFSSPPRRITPRFTADAIGDPATRDSTFIDHVHFEQNPTENFRSWGGDGWYWSNFAQLSPKKPFLISHPDAVLDTPARVRVRLMGWADPVDTRGQYHFATVAVSDRDLLTRRVGAREWRDETSVQFDSIGTFLVADTDTVWVAVAPSDSCRLASCDSFPPGSDAFYNRGVYMDCIDLAYTRRLRARFNELRFQAPVLASGPVEYVVPAFTDTAGLRIWDITNPFQVESMGTRALTPAGGAWTLTVRDTIAVPGTVRRYVVANESRVRPPASVRLYSLPAGLDGAELLRRRTASVDYVIVADESLLPAAEELAAHRAAEMDVAVVTTQAVMDEFGWGLMDPTALRDFSVFVYENWRGGGGAPELDYLLLLGDTSKDFLNRNGEDDPVLVPSYEGRYNVPRSVGGYETDYATDDWYAYVTPGIAPMAFSVGRIPAKTLEEADRMVSRIIAYESDPEWGDWRARVVLAADDTERPSGDEVGEDIHTKDTEDLADFHLPPEAEIEKVYETEYPLRAGFKPDASQRLRDEFDRGALFLNYIGHGDETRLADERLLEWDGTWNPVNGNRRPVMVILSCSVGKFDISHDALAEILLDQPDGGLIGAFSSSFLAFTSYNRLVGQKFYQRTFETSPARTVGAAAMLAKNEIVVAGGAGARQQTERYAVLTDPALEPAWPDYSVHFGAATSDSLLRRGKGFVQGQVYTGPVSDSTATPVVDFAGEAVLLVRAAADTSGFNWEGGLIEYDIPGPPVFWGQLSAIDGALGTGTVPGEGEFFVAGDAPAGNKGRIGVYVYDPVRGIDATGSIPELRVSPQVAVGDSLAADSLGPTITLLEAGGTPIAPARPLLLGTSLTVVVSDPHGVNATGSDPFFTLAYRVDEGDWVDLTRGFRVDAGGFTTGRVNFAFPSSIAPGRHMIYVRAADNLNNRSEISAEIMVTLGTELVLGYLVGYPNPFEENATLVYDLTREADVTVRIYSTAGRLIRTLQETGLPGQNSTLLWDGRDEAGDPVANGVYFVKLDARDTEAGGAPHTATARLARIR